MKPFFSNAATVILTACALVVTGLVVRREFFVPVAVSAEREIRTVDNWRAIAQNGHLMGSQSAPVKIIEFSDFECPFCEKANADLQAVRARYPDQIAVVYRHFPLEAIHPQAFPAAIAAECAGAQGKFEAFHDLLFQNQDSLGVTSWEGFADSAGVPDLDAFRACVEEERFRKVVERDQEAGKEIGVTATPTFIVNGKMFSGSLPAEQWDERIREALEGS